MQNWGITLNYLPDALENLKIAKLRSSLIRVDSTSDTALLQSNLSNLKNCLDLVVSYLINSNASVCVFLGKPSLVVVLEEILQLAAVQMLESLQVKPISKQSDIFKLKKYIN